MKSKDQNPQTPKKNKCYRDHNHKSTIIMYMWGKTHKIKLNSKLQIHREKKKKVKTNLIKYPKIQKIIYKYITHIGSYRIKIS